jgi:hypothetical protein
MPQNSPRDSGSSRRLDSLNEIHILNESAEFRRAKFWFWPIVFGGTIFFGFFDGIKGAFVGFLYGVVGGLFLLHESLRGNRR